ncbi:MAG: hypothetical protein IKE53_08560 [Clostridiales bacterium]|nr:hypothetical protein [Clostridiales bacterium]
MKKVICVLIISLMSVSVFSCSIPFLKQESRVSPDRLYAACEENDAEGYDTLEEITDDLENPRALSAGMFIKAEGKDIRHLFYDESINGLYADAAEELLLNIYSKSIEKATVYMRNEDHDPGVISVLCCSMQFGSYEDADTAYKSCNKYIKSLDDGTSESSSEKLVDGDMDLMFTTLCKGHSAVCFAVYVDCDSVMLLMGSQNKSNDVTVELTELTGYLEIPSPDLSFWDCLATPEIEDRFMALVEARGYQELDSSMPSITRIGSGQGRSSSITGYYLSDDPFDVSGLNLDSAGDPDAITRVGIIYDMSYSAGKSGGIMIYELCYSDEDSAADAYDDILGSLSMAGDYLEETDSGELDGIRYTKFRLEIAGYYYQVYLDGENVYITLCMNSIGNADTAYTDSFNEALEIMGLP